MSLIIFSQASYSPSSPTHYNFIQPEIVVGLFVYYFIGLVLSRIGSLLVEPILKATGFLTFVPYNEFVAACKSDSKIDVLSEGNNTYRTLCAVFIGALFLRLYEKTGTAWPFLQRHDAVIFSGLLLILFVFSYRKQTQYVTKRVKANIL